MRWNTVPGAVRYILISWWDAALAWQEIGGDDLTATAFTHTELTPGLTYYYSVRAVNAAGELGPWSTYPSAVAPSPPAPAPTPTPRPYVSSPPYWLSLHPYYTKYLDAGGVPVLSSNDVSDEEFYQVRDTFLAMLSDRPDLRKTMTDHGFRLLIYPLRFEKGGLTSDLPEFRGLGLSSRVYGAAGRTPYGWVAGGPEVARHCNRVMIHEIAHLIEDAIRMQSGGDRFMQSAQQRLPGRHAQRTLAGPLRLHQCLRILGRTRPRLAYPQPVRRLARPRLPQTRRLRSRRRSTSSQKSLAIPHH